MKWKSKPAEFTKGPSIIDVCSEGEGGGMKNCILERLSMLKWGDRGREGG